MRVIAAVAVALSILPSCTGDETVVEADQVVTSSAPVASVVDDVVPSSETVRDIDFPDSIDDPAFCEAYARWTQLPADERDRQLPTVADLIARDSHTPQTMSQEVLAPMSRWARLQLIDVTISGGCARPEVPARWARFCTAMEPSDDEVRNLNLVEFTALVISRLPADVAEEMSPSLEIVAEEGTFAGAGSDRTVVFPQGYSDRARAALDHVNARYTEFCVAPYVVPPDQLVLGPDAALPPPDASAETVPG